MFNRKAKYIIFTLIVPVIWVCLMGSLYKRHSNQTVFELEPKVSLDNPTEVILREGYRGIYLNGEKAGYVNYSLKQAHRNGKVVYQLDGDTHLTILLGGNKQRIDLTSSSILDSELTLLGFEFLMKTGGHSTRATGTIRDNQMRVQMDGLGGRNVKTIPIIQKSYTADAIDLYLLKRDFPLHRKFQLPVFDPSILGNTNVEIEVMGKEEMTINGEKKEAYVVEERFNGLNQKVWISPKGEILKETAGIMGMNFETISEPKEIAMAVNPSKPLTQDLLYSTSVQVMGDIPDPRNTTMLKLKLHGVTPSEFHGVDDRQQLISATDTNANYVEIEIKSKDLAVPAPKIANDSGKKDFSNYLNPTPLVQSDDPEIRTQAMKIVGQGTNRMAASQKLEEWVHKNMKRQILISVPSAKDILKDKRGDCNEHSTLYAALARSAGIPTKMIVGIVYVNGGFFYHAWNEVWVGQWVPVDATFGQTKVDATHIKLFEGDINQSFQILNYVGKIQVEILDSKVST